jgi:hypothetical protein
LKPTLGVTGKLLRADGSVVWQKYEYITNLNGQTPSHTLDEYLTNPEVIGEVFAVASKIVTAELGQSIRGA